MAEEADSTDACVLLATGLSCTHPRKWNVLGSAGPRNADAQSASLRENRPSRYPRAFPARRPTLRLAPLEGRAPHAHNEGIGFARACPPWALGSSITPGDHDTPRFRSGPYLRTHGVRPSEKTVFRVISGLSPQGHPTLGGPPLGGAGSARPHGNVFVSPRHVPARSSVLGQPPSEGRAPHARKEGITQTTTLPRFGHGPFADPGVAMTCPGFGPARICGRAERVPPTKSPPTLFPAFPRKAVPHRLTPSEGRAPHAHNEGIGFARACPPWALGSSITPGDHDTPRFAAGLTTRTHRVRPSEKTAFRVIPGFSQLGHLALDGPPRGGAGSGRPQCKSPRPSTFSSNFGTRFDIFCRGP